MKNLKKVLALVMAFAMAFTMMAGAAYTDQADITAVEAVDTLTALGVMSGDPDGSFRPGDTITRAEAARIIYTIRSGGNSDASAYAGMQTTFTDVPSTAWYAGYVKHIQSVGIVSGKSATIFDPNAPVTGVEMALMALRVMGYDPARADIGGSTWSMKTIGYATEAGILDDVTPSNGIHAALPRQYAAQIMYNMLDSSTVRWSNDAEAYTSTGSDNTPNETVGHKYMNLVTYEGVLSGSGSYGSNAGKNKIGMVSVDKINNKATTSATTKTWEYKKDVADLVNQYVKVSTGKNDVVYGVSAVTDKNTVVTAAFKDVEIDGSKVKVGGTSYSFKNVDVVDVNGTQLQYTDNDTPTPNTNVGLTINKILKKVASGDQITFISNDGDSEFDVAVVNAMTSSTGSVDKITYVSSTEIIAGGTSYDLDDVVAPEGLKKDDHIAVVKDLFTDDDVLVKADVVEGKVTATKGSPVTDVRIDGEWYIIGNTKANQPFNNALTYVGNGIGLNDTVEAQVINGVIYRADVKSAGSTDTAIVLAAPGSMDVNGGYQVKLLFADGSIKVISAENQYFTLENELVTWEIDDDKYELTAVGPLNLVDGDSYGTGSGYDKDAKALAGKKVDNDAVIYVQYKDGGDKQRVMTGRELNALGGNIVGTSSYVLDGGLVVLAHITTTGYLPGVNADQLYGYVTSGITEISENGVTYKTYDLYTTAGETVNVKQKASTAIAKEDFIKLNLTADGYAESVTNLTGTSSVTMDAVLNYGSDYLILAENGTVTLDDDVKYLVINSKDVKGIGNEADLQKAAGTGTANEYFVNVAYYTEGTPAKGVLVVIDVTNKWDGDLKANQAVAKDLTTLTLAAGTTKGITTVTAAGIGVTNYALTGVTATPFVGGTTETIALTATADTGTVAAAVIEGVAVGGTTKVIPVNGDDFTISAKGDFKITITVTEADAASKTYTIEGTVS